MSCWQSSLSLALAGTPAASRHFCQLEGNEPDLQIHQKVACLSNFTAQQTTPPGWSPGAKRSCRCHGCMSNARGSLARQTGTGLHPRDDGVQSEMDNLH